MKQENQGKIKPDIHGFDARISSVLKRLESELSPENMLLVKRYHNAIIVDNAGVAVQEKHLQTILSLSRMYQKNWQDVTRNDIENLLLQISKNHSDAKGQETHTSFDYKKVLKIFVRWIKTGNRLKNPDIQEPIEIRSIKTRRVKDRLSREDLITQTDVDRLIHACGENLRDKAFISTLFESGGRIGEILTIAIKHVTPDKYGIKIKVDGKTNARPILLVESLPYLSAWLNAHPSGKDGNAPLFINMSGNQYGNQLSYRGVTKILEKRARIAGITKRIYPHLFRHSKITQTATFMNESLQKKRYGWTGSSKMAERYTHLVDQDVDHAMLSHYGLVEEDKTNSSQTPKMCPTCKFLNEPRSKLCSQCAKPLNLESAISMEEEQEKVNQDLSNKLNSMQETMEKKFKEIEDARKIRDIPTIKTTDQEDIYECFHAQTMDEKYKIHYLVNSKKLLYRVCKSCYRKYKVTLKQGITKLEEPDMGLSMMTSVDMSAVEDYDVEIINKMLELRNFRI